MTLPPNALRTAIAAADAAGAAIRPHFRTALRTDRKADESPVTIADRAAERAMRAVIAASHPDHAILGEEFGTNTPPQTQAANPWRWVLDPIDGTRAFITGRPLFGTLIALMHQGTPVLGIIDQPITGERWVGQSGQTTMFHGPFGGRPGTRRCAALADAELSATSPEMLGHALPRWQHLARAVRRTSWGGDCYAYGLLALGQIDIVAERELNLWDWAALVPIVEGAGGRMTDWQGNTLTENGAGEVVAVGDAALLPGVVARLKEGWVDRDGPPKPPVET